jgi:thiaminase
MADGQDFVRQLRRDTEPLMRGVTEHVFVRDTSNGLLPREALMRFAEQEHHYVRGIYDYFAMCVLQAPDLDMKEWFIEVASREVGYLATSFRHSGSALKPCAAHNHCRVPSRPRIISSASRAVRHPVKIWPPC